MAIIAAPPKAKARRLLNSEEFLEWLQPGVFADLIDGKIVMHSPVNLRHARLVNFADRLIGSYVEHEDSGELHRESVAVRLSIRETFLPDLAFFTARTGGRIDPQMIQRYFRLACVRAGVHRNDSPRFQPRLHDLRHTFAVHRLTSWYEKGADVQRLPPRPPLLTRRSPRRARGS